MAELLTRILIIPFLSSKVFKLANDKQQTDELNISLRSKRFCVV